MKLRRIIGWGFVTIVVALFALLLVGYWTSTNACEAPDFNDAPAHPTKAIVYCRYGLADVLELRSVEKPTPRTTKSWSRCGRRP